MSQHIDPGAWVSPKARLAENVTISRGAQVAANVEIGENSFIGPNVIVGEPVAAFYSAGSAYEKKPITIGDHAILRSGTIVYDGVAIDSHFQSGPYVVIRERTMIGKHCSLGNNCDVQADVRIGDYTRCHSNVTLGQHSIVGKYCWLMPYVILMNDVYPPIYLEPTGPQINDFTVLGGRVVVFPVRIGKHVIAGAQSQITKDVEDFSVVSGIPAERVGDCRHIVAVRKDGTKYRPYPWPRHRHEGYPFSDEEIEQLDL